MLLRDIPGLLPTLEHSFLAKSKLWSREVETIMPEQLVALGWLAKEAGEEDVDDKLFYAVTQVHMASIMGMTPAEMPILKFRLAHSKSILSTELTDGLVKLPPPMMRAAIFGLETDLSMDRLLTLSYMQAKNMDLSETARIALRNQTRSISSALAFWQCDPLHPDQHGTLRGFANEIYITFGMSWNALRLAYKRMIPAHF